MRVSKSVTLLLGLLLFGVLALAGCGSGKGQDQEGRAGTDNKAGNAAGRSLVVYSGAGLKNPVEEIGAAFQAQTGLKLTYTFGGAAQLNNQILLSKQGDVYLPGDIAELKPVKEKDLVAWEKNVVYHIPVLAVPKGNPAGIHRLADLGRPGVKVALGDPQANPIGKLADQLLQKHGLLETVNKNVVVRTPTANELVVYLSTRQADAAVIWEENYQGAKDKLEVVPVPELKDYVKTVPVAVLSCSQEKATARQLAEFFTSPAAYQIWQKWGYKPVSQ
ncbi:molybdate ABC transporter substrate-binding protein [Moorella sp. Hama-1]|uniref:molybdate ABC transporter substrate-binding protein n=1 Tax=Moorella sp. Hama-1 TaxID=2138101 RepID=UPI00137B90D5|nr:molybdate ABC transporter substrate-binding protein [Moorella sp. Hama-1]BCV21661.1 molybdenum ABC transporter substrate-binding protein [Moorella sp. Hama-1]